jgi:hypothetical protein
MKKSQKMPFWFRGIGFGPAQDAEVDKGTAEPNKYDLPAALYF